MAQWVRQSIRAIPFDQKLELLSWSYAQLEPLMATFTMQYVNPDKIPITEPEYVKLGKALEELGMLIRT